MQNFRTYTDQTEYISQENLALDFFQAGQEIETVQQVQHEMLAKLAQRGVADSVAIVMDVLKRDKQREPLLVTSTGVVVNGNRRLAAMRELFASSSGEYSDFSHIDLAILPSDATLADILDIEAGLQAKQETKLDYDWVGDAQLMDAMVKQHGQVSDVSKLLNRSDREIRNTISALKEADLYLKEWVGKSSHYSLVRDDAEQLFKDIPKSLEGKNTQLQQASRVIAWTLFENRSKLTDRLYSYNAAFGKLASDVMERVSEKLGISTEAGINGVDEGFDIDFGANEGEVSYDEIIEQLKDPETKGELVEVLIESAQNAIEVSKGQKSGQASLKAVVQAHSKLMAVDISLAAAETRVPIKKQLEAIENLARLLILKIERYDS